MKITLQIAALAAKILPARMKAQLYRNPKLAKKIRNTLNAASPVGLTKTHVAGGLIQGFLLNLDMQTEKDYWLGTYEINLQAAIKKFCLPGMVVYDIGANIGYISLIFAKQVGAQGSVFAFEPLPDNFQRLTENIALNKLNSHISTFQAAIVDVPGTTSFFVHKSGAMGKAKGSLGREEQYLSQINVKAVALDDFIFSQDHPHPDLIKMDIEGGEVLAIKGMHKTLLEIKPTMLIEIHSHSALDCLWTEFQAADYHLFKMEKGYPEIINITALGERTYALAIPNKKAG
jgi:FkbM family methyltransferase